jgi:hypothetical protein
MFRYGRYPLPNDDEEFNRESMKHVMFKELMDGKLFLAPIGENPQKIIDLGTGFGDWAIEGMSPELLALPAVLDSHDVDAVGEKLPSARVIGVDLSPIQPQWVPPNVEFQVEDIEEDWRQESDFDYVHLRVVLTILRNQRKVLSTALT